jgi:hypothetical protein
MSALLSLSLPFYVDSSAYLAEVRYLHGSDM